jgi:hypothetical protein
MGGKMSINVFDFLTHLEQERYRAIILHAAPEKGLAVTIFAQKICQRTGGKYLDLLELFIQSKEISESIDRFGPEKLRALLIEQSQTQSLLIVDRADFLIDTWRKAERDGFYRLFKEQWDGYKAGMRARVVICLQTSQEIDALHITDSQGQSRIFRLTDFNDIL